MERISDLERKYAAEALDGQFKTANGYKLVSRLEAAFAEKMGVRYAIAFTNGTATLHTALEAAGVGLGDEVIVPPLTMSATCIAVLQANAIPVFADVCEKTFLITAQEIEKKITKRTKAIIIVSLFGLMPDMDPIMALAEKHGLAVIEDDAQCFLGTYKGRLAGTIGHASSFSFQSSKHMTCGEGGMVTTNDEDLALKIRRYSGMGYGSIGLKKGRITKKDIQDPMCERHVVMGWNYRMSDVVGGVALGQLERLDELVKCRVDAANMLNSAVGGCKWLVPQHTPDNCVHSYWAYVVRLDNPDVSWYEFRDKFMELGGDGIYAAWQLSYLEPMFQSMNMLGRERLINLFGDYRYERGLCPVAERLQPKLLQFKTNYWNAGDAQKQAEILGKTISFFDKK